MERPIDSTPNAPQQAAPIGTDSTPPRPTVTPRLTADRPEILRTLHLLCAPGDLHELRALHTRQLTQSGYFDDLEKFADAAAKITSGNVYLTLNPCIPDLLARACNRVKPYARDATKDEHIIRRHWLLIDADPTRPTGVSATDSEKAAAEAVALRIRGWLAGYGFPAPVFADSGNGFHLLYRVDLENTPEILALFDRFLETLATEFNTTGDTPVTIDTAVSNAARICKLYGTVARKGDSIPDRPHRLSRLIDVPETLTIVPRALLESVAGQPPPTAPAPAPVRRAAPRLIRGVAHPAGDWLTLDVVSLAKAHGAYGRDLGNGKHAILCPWAAGHSDDRGAEDSDTVIYEPDGVRKPAFKCLHNTCAHRKIRDLREMWTDFDAHCSAPWVPDALPPRASGAAPADDEEGGERPGQKAHAARLLALAEDLTLCHDSMGQGWVDIPGTGGRRTLKLHSGSFRDWMTRRFYLEHGAPPSKDALAGTIAVLQAKATHDGELDNPTPRLAFRDGRLYLDLVDETGRCAEITPDGWSLTQAPPVRFRRPPGLGALPHPVRGGSLADLGGLLNVRVEDLTLVTGWLIACFSPYGGLPILLLHGEQGSAKSFTACLLRDLIDPGKTELAAPPRDEGTLAIAAENSLICAYDNLSGLSADMSDAFCRLATGAGFRKRKLYSDDEEVLFTGRRPLLLTGIADVARRSDLLSRSLIVTLPRIPEAECKPEETLRQEFTDAAPYLLGALLDAVVMALRHRERVVGPFPRLADAARFVTAAEPALGWAPRTFLSVLSANHQEIHETALDGHPVPAVLRKWLALQAEQTWVGTWDALRLALGTALPDFKPPKEWPETARKLSADLERLAPNLRAVGVHFERQQRAHGGIRNVKLWATLPPPQDSCKTPSPPSLRHSPIPHPGNSSGESPQTGAIQPKNTGLGAETPEKTGDGRGDGMSDGVGYRHPYRHPQNGGYQQTVGVIPSNYPVQTRSSDGGDGGDGVLPPSGGGRWRALHEHAGSPPLAGASGSLLSRNALRFDGCARILDAEDEVWLIVRDEHRIPAKYAALPRMTEAAPAAAEWLNADAPALVS